MNLFIIRVIEEAEEIHKKQGGILSMTEYSQSRIHIMNILFMAVY